jgi:alpha-acetolactate decarboxylase
MPNLTVVIPSSLATILAANPRRESDNLFCALRVDGVFERMHTRVVKATSEGTGLVGVHVDYRQNVKLFEQVYEGSII